MSSAYIPPRTIQPIQEPERRSTTMPTRPSLPRGLEQIPPTTILASAGIPTTHSAQESRPSITSAMTTTVPTTATRTIPITREERRSRALEAVRRLVGPDAETTSQTVPELIHSEARIMSPPTVT